MILGNEIVASKIVELGFSAEPKAVDEAACKIVCNINMQDVENVVDAFKEQDELLSKAKEFEELRRKYAALEAATYKRIVDRGWAKALGLSTNIRRAAEWIAESPEKYEERIRSILNGGHTLISLWKEACRVDEKMTYLDDSIRAKRRAVSDYGLRGRASLEPLKFFKEREYHFDRYIEASNEIDEFSESEQIQEAVLNSARIELRKLGAVGIGDGEYVDPEKYPDEVNKAVGIRRKNIACCVNRLRELCEIVDTLDFEKELTSALLSAQVEVDGLTFKGGR